MKDFRQDGIALVGMACRLPGADTPQRFWDNLRQGRCGVQRWSNAALRQAGLPDTVINDPAFVPATAFLSKPEAFDAFLFGMSGREAETTDPQHRLLLETAYAALEDAGLLAQARSSVTGVYAGATLPSYLLYNLAANPQRMANLDPVQINIGNAADFLASRVAYKLDLRGPALGVQTACSTGLVAVHEACESLLREECDMALAGAASINLGFRHGYRCLEGGMLSPDGVCRPFDAKANGTLFGSGAVVVVLKRLEDALDDGDAIYSVIAGTAINNDGARKAGYTAPGVEGQAQVIAEALAAADVDADTVDYVEAHGTATPLGDPIEVQALTKAFRRHTQRRGFCALGSVKGNVGHLDAAAGLVGLIKTALSIQHGLIAPTLHFEQPNPNIDFAATPFQVAAQAAPWPETNGRPRRAGVSAFGVGGTNAHVVLEQAPQQATPTTNNRAAVLPLSAATASALQRTARALVDHDSEYTAAAAYSLATGRPSLRMRRLATLTGAPDWSQLLHAPTVEVPQDRPREAVFAYGGQGLNLQGAAHMLYRDDTDFRAALDQLWTRWQPKVGHDLRAVLVADPQVDQPDLPTQWIQPATVLLHMAMTHYLHSLGIQPQATMGHSLGELSAAWAAGCLDDESLCDLVLARARAMADLPAGAMLSVPLAADELQRRLQGAATVAVINGPSRCVVSGPTDDVEQMARALAADGIACRRLPATIAFHSAAVDAALSPWDQALRQVNWQQPQRPVLSNRHGGWHTADDLCDPNYWREHMRQPVRFDLNLDQLWSEAHLVMVDMGPGRAMQQLALAHPNHERQRTVCAAWHDAEDPVTPAARLLGNCWLAGLQVDWQAAFDPQDQHKLRLPTYGFDREHYWIDAPPALAPRSPQVAASSQQAVNTERLPISQWCNLPGWRRLPLPPPAATHHHWLLIHRGDPANPLTDTMHALRQHLEAAGHSVTVASTQHGEHVDWQLDNHSDQPFHSWLQQAAAQQQLPDKVIICGNHEDNRNPQALLVSFQTLRHWLQAWQALATDRAVDVVSLIAPSFHFGGSTLEPSYQATVHGLGMAANLEIPGLRFTTVDCHQAHLPSLYRLAAAVPRGPLLLRGHICWQRHFEPLPLAAAAPVSWPNGTALITGGLIEMGHDLVRHLAHQANLNVVCIETAEFPPEANWSEWLTKHSAQDPIAARIRVAQAMQADGLKLQVLPVDWRNEDALAGALTALQAVTPVSLVVHNARILGERAFRTIDQLGSAESDWQFDCRIRQLRVLLDHVNTDNLAEVIINTSLAAHGGGVGMAAYAAANLYLGEWAESMNNKAAYRVLAVAWDAWANTQVAAVSKRWGQYALQADEAITLLERLRQDTSLAHVVVSTLPLQQRLIHRPRRQSAVTAATDHGKGNPRPPLPTPYVPPAEGTESKLAIIWQAQLGIDGIGARDNFFDLGGDSLLAIQTVGQIKRDFAMDLPVTSLYEGLTLRKLAALMDDLNAPQDTQAQTAKREARADRRRQALQQQRRRRHSGGDT